jgi:hypothetical protein
MMHGANSGIPSAATVNRTQDVNPLENVLKFKGIIVKILTMSASGFHLIACQ